ncbi:MAG: DsbA family oxidoreductase [Pseudomonadota bacterium]|nr:DsbA family oxidoreductase [Pseudomonadota bacterium]
MKIDVVSDTVCPWCFVGKRRLEEAILALNRPAAEIRWRPFQLDPSIPLQGCDYLESLSRKYGEVAVKRMQADLQQVGESVGIEFRFDKIQRRPTTMDSHRLLEWAYAEGVQNEVAEELFQVFFCEGADIGDIETLVAVDEKAGMDGGQVSSRLKTDDGKRAVDEQCQQAIRQGVNGVPFFTFDGKYSFSGAQSAEVFRRALDSLGS